MATHRSDVFAVSDDIVSKLAETNPILATQLGVDGHERELPDFSPEKMAADALLLHECATRMGAQVAADDVDRIAREVTIEQCSNEARHIDSGEAARTFSVLVSPVGEIRQVFELMAAGTPEDAENVRARLEQVPASLDTWRACLRQVVADSHVPSARHVLGVAEQADTQAKGGYESLARRVAAEAGVDAEASGLVAAATRAQGALVELATFLRGEIAPHASTDEGCGAERYAQRTTYFSGATIDVREAYEWGYEDLRQLVERMGQLAATLAPGARSLKDAADQLDQDPAQVVVGTDAILDRLRSLTQEAIEQLDGQYFDIDPRIRTCDARLAPEGSATAPYYMDPSEDLSRPGTTWLPTDGKNEFPWWRLVSTWYHEGVPGHHLQLATCVIDRENQSRFQRTLGSNSAYIEGWALYAERLMHELGYFSDPAAEFGFLSSQAFRAARVVVDIGMHLSLRAPKDLGELGDLGDCSGMLWTPEMARALLEERAIIEPPDARSEIDRYLGWAGQAICYKIGERAWLAARKAARTRVGDSFSLRAWHNHALSTGSLGLDQFEREMARWDGETRR